FAAACTLRVRPVAVLVAVTFASVAGAESTDTWPRIVADVDCAKAAGAPSSMQAARAQLSRLRSSLCEGEQGDLRFIVVPLPGLTSFGNGDMKRLRGRRLLRKRGTPGRAVVGDLPRQAGDFAWLECRTTRV